MLDGHRSQEGGEAVHRGLEGLDRDAAPGSRGGRCGDDLVRDVPFTRNFFRPQGVMGRIEGEDGIHGLDQHYVRA